MADIHEGKTRLDCDNCNLHKELNNVTAAQVIQLIILAGAHKLKNPNHSVHMVVGHNSNEPSSTKSISN